MHDSILNTPKHLASRRIALMGLIQKTGDAYLRSVREDKEILHLALCELIDQMSYCGLDSDRMPVAVHAWLHDHNHRMFRVAFSSERLLEGAYDFGHVRGNTRIYPLNDQGVQNYCSQGTSWKDLTTADVISDASEEKPQGIYLSHLVYLPAVFEANWVDPSKGAVTMIGATFRHLSWFLPEIILDGTGRLVCEEPLPCLLAEVRPNGIGRRLLDHLGEFTDLDKDECGWVKRKFDLDYYRHHPVPKSARPVFQEYIKVATQERQLGNRLDWEQ